MDKEMKEKVKLYITGELDEVEHREVLDWIRSAHRNRSYYDRLRTALMVADYSVTERKYDLERVRCRLNSRIELAGKERKADFKVLFRVAASLLLLVSTYVVFQSIREYKSIQTTSVIYNTIESPFGSRARVYLPDSTYVVLNAGSTIRYPVDFLSRNSREVLLSGEGFFEVKKHKHSEFVVKVGDIGITALGTSFNVKAYPEEAEIEATLVEGLLRIRQGDSKTGAIILKPNEKISLLKAEGGIPRESVGPISVKREESAQIQKIPIRKIQVSKRIDPIPEISWKDKEWVIRGETMEELSVMLERRYNVDIVLGDEEVGSFCFSGTLKDETLQQVLYAIRTTAPVDYKIEGSRVVLTQNKALRRIYQKMLKGSSS